jgi:hypothetical protein
MHTNDTQEQAGDRIIYANGDQVGRSIPGIAFYCDFPWGIYAFSAQSDGLNAARPGQQDTLQLAPRSQIYLEDLAGRHPNGWANRCAYLICLN